MSFSTLLKDVRSCRHCLAHLPHEPRPVVQIHPDAKILIAGQAPGRKVHESGIPFNDASGERLREWLGIDREKFYNPKLVAILPMGFCFPGTGKGGDLPPRPECAKLWRERLLAQLQQVELTLVIGKYAQDYHLGGARLSVTDQVRAWQQCWPSIVPLPHPSPRNNIWLRRNSWFESELVPELRKRVSELI
ncbi:uracil-DNA glycosylase family protein [Motilimonas cestriensis]|uniref:uracil-DNA glycosylase family protein n=1 Tax=Motilimonas cestriensis TaxID=2742685 RepID=UPI003D007BBB